MNCDAAAGLRAAEVKVLVLMRVVTPMLTAVFTHVVYLMVWEWLSPPPDSGKFSKQF